MKKLITILLVMMFTFGLLAQPPEKISYQAVVRNSINQLVTNQPVGIKISILQTSATGTVVYAETQTPTTNANGLISISIGTGTVVNGTFSTINWAAGPYFIKTEIDPAGGTAYSITATSQLLSVPYALHAKTVQTGDNWGTDVVKTDITLAGNGTTSTPLKVSDNAVNSLKIQDGSIATVDLADQTVTNVKLGNLAISADKIQNSAITTDKLANGSVTGAKIAQAGATSGQALKWNGTTWAPATDATGGGSGGWTDDGNIIRLTTQTDTVQMGSVNRLGKFNVGGNMHLSLPYSIYFGSEAARITGLTGGDMRLVAEDLSMLTTEDITFGRFGDATWIKFDNANKRVGIGSLTPSDKLHVVINDAAEGLSAIRGVANSAAGSAYGIYGQAAGFKGRGVMGEATGTSSIGVMGLATNSSSTGVWGEGSNQGVYGKSDLATGKGIFGQVTSATGYSGYFDGGKFYISGNTGIGTTTPAKKLHVYGSAQVKDTLFASAVKVTNSPRVFYKNSSTGWPKNISTMESWGPLDSVTVVAPGPGSVLLNVTGFLQSSHTYLGNTWVYIGISAIRRSSNYEDAMSNTVWLLHETLVGGFYQVPCAVTAVASVPSAGTYKYYIVGWFNEWDGEEDEVDFGDGAISALFIPAP